MSQVLMEARVILDDLQAYRGAGEEIRQVSTSCTCLTDVVTLQTQKSLLVNSCVCVCVQAIQSPGVEGVQEKAWAAVVPLVTKLKTFYEFSQKLGNNLTTASSLNNFLL